MLEERIRNLVLHRVRMERLMTISGRRDPSLSRTISTMREPRTTTDSTEVFQVYACIISERFKNALSDCRLLYIDFHPDCHTDGPVDCCNDFCIECWTQIFIWISGAGL